MNRSSVRLVDIGVFKINEYDNTKSYIICDVSNAILIYEPRLQTPKLQSNDV